MDLHTETYTFQKLLVLKKKYIVPRYQREFSWGKAEIDEMYQDIIKRLKYSEEKQSLINTEYFFGNILLQGDLAGSTKELYIIDGQQRLTAITIFLSVLSKKFSDAGETELKKAIWNYIIAKDDDGNDFAVFSNSTPYPFFQYKVQCFNVEEKDPATDEEDRIESAYNYFDKKLSKRTLCSDIKTLYGKDLGYVDILKLLRDQLLQSFVICSWTTDSKYANLIFEIMNAKGKELETIDLIKNDLFDNLSEQDPVDFARDEWKKIHENLSDENVRLPFSTFFRHFWSSQYGKTTGRKLWDNYRKNIKTKEDCKNFILKLDSFSKLYFKIVNSHIANFKNRKELQYIVDGLHFINDDLNVDMPRLFLLNVYDKYNNSLITSNQFGAIVKFISRFHFVYNGVCSLRTNKLDSTYCAKSVELKDSDTKEKCLTVLNSFKADMIKYLPDKDTYISQLRKLKYSSSQKLSSNPLCRFFLNEIENIVSKEKNNKINSSIEHTLGEDENNVDSLCLDKLMLVEMNINNSLPKIPLKDKVEYYKKSSYASVVNLLSYFEKAKSSEELIMSFDEWFVSNANLFYDSIN